MKDTAHDNACPVEDIAAYLDGELHGPALDSFEAHLDTCRECAGELRTQRQLLCTIDAALTDPMPFSLPKDFTRVVAVHAESDLSGIRNQTERRRALQLCAILALGAFGLLGAAAGSLVFQPTRTLLQLVARIFDLLWQTTYDASIGLVVILRMVGRGLFANPGSLGLLLAALFAFAISLLPRLIAKYHRAQI